MTALQLVGQVVDVEVTKEKRCKAQDVRGLLWNIDPETGCSVLVVRKGEGESGGFRVVVVTGHGIIKISRAAASPEETASHLKAAAKLGELMSETTGSTLTLQEVTARLTHARLPFTTEEQGTVSVLDGAAEILPPYGPHSVRSTNDQEGGMAVFFLLAVFAYRADDAVLWRSYKAAHGKVYSPAEEGARRRLFARNVQNGVLNMFSDMSDEEFRKHLGAGVRPVESRAERVVMPPAIDWRTAGAVTPVKSQGRCVASWAFAAVGSVEAQWYLAGHPLVSLSEQELVSCDTHDAGCAGGFTNTAYEWLLAHNGTLFTEQAYPYTSADGHSHTCYTPHNTEHATVTSFERIVQLESAIANRVYNHGPVSVWVDASGWKDYTGGVLTNCTGRSLNHAVLLVGYTDEYWIAKNSWGTDWGEKGYLRLQVGTNQCGMAAYASTASVRGVGPTPAGETPAPTGNGYFVQKTCISADCSDNCLKHTVPLLVCQDLPSGGSLMANSCNKTTVTMNEYGSTGCSGTPYPTHMPVGVCTAGTSGNYFMNYCHDEAS